MSTLDKHPAPWSIRRVPFVGIFIVDANGDAVEDSSAVATASELSAAIAEIAELRAVLQRITEIQNGSRWVDAFHIAHAALRAKEEEEEKIDCHSPKQPALLTAHLSPANGYAQAVIGRY